MAAKYVRYGIVCCPILLLSALVSCANSKFVIRELPQGSVRGVVKNARNGDPFVAFLGLPYAEPPINSLRWEPPLAMEDSWHGVLDATQHPQLCLQASVNNPKVIQGSEDCLYLNIFVKDGKQSEKTNETGKHVMVWFHGGAFIFGGIDYFGAEYFMENDDVILVTVQYRLNAFGYMTTEDEAMPGNYGSLDQLEALKWIQKNIEFFGGNPNEVTIFGMSAGGASVHYLTLSPLARDLYKNAISLSGSALCWWANIPQPRKNALKLAEHFKCTTDDSHEMKACLKKEDGSAILKAQSKLFFNWHMSETEREPMSAFSPRSDPERNSRSFLPEHPYVAMLNGHINPTPHMMGYTNKEGIWRANQLLPDGPNDKIWKQFLANYDEIALMAYGLSGNQTENPSVMLRTLNKFYKLNGLEKENLNDEKIHNFIDVLSDSMFIYAIDETTKLRSYHKNMDTYFYMLTYPGEHTLANKANDGSYRRPVFEALKGASHGSDMLLIFPMFNDYPTISEQDEVVSRKFIRLLIDFGIQDGSPPIVHGWKPLDMDNPSYLLIDGDLKLQKGLPLQERMDFWNALPPVYWRYVLSKRHRKDEL